MSTGSDLENTSIEYIDKLEARSKTLGSKTAGVLASAVERELRELRGGYDKLLSSGGKDGSYTTAQAAARIQNTIDDLGSLVSPKEINRLNRLYKDEVARASQLGKQAGLDLSNTLNGNDTLKKNARANRRAIEAAGRRLEQFWGNENQLFKDRVTALTQTALAQGKSYRQLALQVRELLIRDQHQSASSQAKNKRYGIKGRADLIARTELQSAFIGGSIDRFRQRGVEWVRWSAAAERTCPFCMSRDGLIYELDEVESDIPAHPRCRCTLLPSHKPKDWKGNPNQKKDATDQLDDAYWAKSRAKKLEQWKKEHLQKKPNDKQDLNALLRRYMDTPTNSRRRLLGTDKAPKPQWMPSGSFIPNAAGVALLTSKVEERPDEVFTYKRFSNAKGDEPLSDTTWTLERQKLHDEIIKKFLSTGTRKANPIFTMSGGGPASGKGFMLEKAGFTYKEGKKTLVKKGRVLIDADEIKKMIPEYKDAQKKGGTAQQRAASVVHEESSYLSKRIMAEAAKRRFDVILDGTGDSGLRSLAKKIQKMRDMGYEVKAKYVSADTNVAADRNWDRFLKSGRLPPEWMLRNVHADISRTLPKAIKSGLFDEVELFDTNLTGKLRKVASQKGGKGLTVHNKKLWDDFLKKGEAAQVTEAAGEQMIDARRLSAGLMKVPELKALAKKQGLQGYSKMNKAQLEALVSGVKPEPTSKPTPKPNNANAVAKAKRALTNAPERNELQKLRNRQHDLDWKIEGLEIQERDGTIKKGGTEIRKLRLEKVNNQKTIDVLDKKMERYYDAMLDAELLGSKTKALTPAQVDRMKTHVSAEADPLVAKLVKQGKVEYNYRLPLEKTYSRHEGFHDRPELTKNAQSWWDRTDLITDKTSGLNKPFFRGVSSTNFRDTFQGKGKNGGTHYGGEGIFGHGTYAATSVTSHWDDIWKAAAEAESYSYSAGVKSPDRMTMFGLKKGTRILELDSWSDKPAWTEDSFRRTAQRRLKTQVSDVGELAAAMGYDAAIVKKSAGDWDQDFWVVFNRSKVVAVEGGMAKNFPEQVGQGAQGGQEGVKVKKPKSQKKLDYTNTDAVVAELQRFNSEVPDTLNRILDLPIIATPHETQVALKANKPMAKDLSKTLKKNLKELEKSGADEYAIDAYAELTELVDMMTL